MKHLIFAIALFSPLSTMLPAGVVFSSVPPATVPRSPTVRAVAAHPAQYLGRLVLTGVVGIVTPGKGFIMVDMREYRREGFACLAKDEPTKIPVQWKGAAPKIKQIVRVDGTLVKGKKGYAFIAKRITKK